MISPMSVTEGWSSVRFARYETERSKYPAGSAPYELACTKQLAGRGQQGAASDYLETLSKDPSSYLFGDPIYELPADPFQTACFVCGRPDLAVESLQILHQIECNMSVIFVNYNDGWHFEDVLWLSRGHRQEVYVNRRTMLCDVADDYCQRLIGQLPAIGLFGEKFSVSGEVILSLGDLATPGALGSCSSDPTCFLVPDSIFLQNQGYRNFVLWFRDHQVPWSERQDRVVWRGSSSGSAPQWTMLPRVKLCRKAKELAHLELFDCLISIEAQVSALDATTMRQEGLFSEAILPQTELLKYKYHIDIDGNTNSWPGLFLKLLSGSPVLKIASEHNYSQWYYDRLVPFANFIPVRSDLVDLEEKALWLRRNQAEAEAIGQAGRLLACSLDLRSQKEEYCRIASRAFAASEHKASYLPWNFLPPDSTAIIF